MLPVRNLAQQKSIVNNTPRRPGSAGRGHAPVPVYIHSFFSLKRWDYVTIPGRKLGEDGLEEGLEKGLEKGRYEVVIEMKNEGLADEVIARVTKLPLERVREIHP